MIGKYKYTFVSLIFAAFFIFGSMTAMNYILRISETRLLTESGRVEVESPVRAWENDEESSVSEDFRSERYILNMQQVEDAIKCWNKRTNIILHDPVAGQISMEEAIEAGEKWLIEMKIGEEIDEMSYSINAELGISGPMEYAGEKLEAYYSFWTVQYSSQSMSAILYINAVTEKVWGAEIASYDDLQEELPYERLRFFVELAGLQVSDDNSAIIEYGGSKTEIAIKDSRLYAQESIYNTVKMNGDELSGDDSYTTIYYRLIERTAIIYNYNTTN